jgi:hypothetical protein
MSQDKPQFYSKLAWGFEEMTCTRCGEVKGGNPYRLCRCQREDRGIMDGRQPHINPEEQHGQETQEASTAAPNAA